MNTPDDPNFATSKPAGAALAGDVAVVTGAARGIGLGVARRLAAAGATLVIVDRDAAAIEAASGEFEGGRARVADLSDAADVAACFAAIEATHGRVDILVNNAGIVRDKRFLKISDDDWDGVIAANLRSQFLCARAVLPGMTQRGHGRIVNMSSRAWLGAAGQAAYAAAKGGVVSLTRSLALEFARFGITVNAIAPGIVDTPLFRAFEPELQARLAESVPVRRIGTADDIALAVEFFARRDASYVTGQVLYVCGGRSLSSASV